MDERPWRASDYCRTFSWQGSETEERTMHIDDLCEGGIAFLGNGNIEGGVNFWMRTLKFTGRRRDGPGAAVRPAADMRAEWDHLASVVERFKLEEDW